MNKTMTDVTELSRKVISGFEIDRQKAIDLYSYPDAEALFTAADTIRQHFTGNTLDTCSIVNARSGICSEDCAWCSQSVFHTTGVARYDIIDEKEAVGSALANEDYGVHRFSMVTASRAFPVSRVKKACDIYRKIRQEGKGRISLCASMGLLDLSRMKMLKEAGVTHYHINLETSRRFSRRLSPNTRTMKNCARWDTPVRQVLKYVPVASSAWVKQQKTA